MQEYYSVVFPVEAEKFSPEKSVKDRAYLPQALVIMTWLNKEVNSHTGNLITICLMHGWRSKGASSTTIGALFRTDISISQNGLPTQTICPIIGQDGPNTYASLCLST